MFIDPKASADRQLANRVEEIKSQMSSIDSDLKKMEREKSEIDLKLRELKNEMQKIKTEKESLEIEIKRKDEEAFTMQEDYRLLKKKLNEALSQIKQNKQEDEMENF